MSPMTPFTQVAPTLNQPTEIDTKHDTLPRPEAPETLKEGPSGVAAMDNFRKHAESKRRYTFWACFVLFTIALALSGDTTYLYLAFATSSFTSNTLLSTIALLTAILGAVCQPFWGKMADASRRSWCLILSVAWYTIGYALSASAQSVQALAAGQVVYSLGTSGLNFLQTLIVADLTSLQYRGVAFGLISITYIPFAFVAPNIASGIGLRHWRWGYGMFCIIMPVCVVPIITVLMVAERRVSRGSALNTGWKRDKVVDSLSSVDFVGLILIGFAFALLLAPTTLYSRARDGWRNPSMIAMEVCGAVILAAFGIWEWKFASNPILPRRILNRNFCLSAHVAIIQFSCGSMYNTYWSSWVWVVQEYSERQWTYICETSAVSLCVFTLLGGLALRFVGRYKVIQICGQGVCLIGAGVNYYSSLPGRTTTATLVMSQMLIQGGAGFGLLAAQTVAQGSLKHQDLAIGIAVWIFLSSMSSGIGGAIAGAMWNGNLAKNLSKRIPDLTLKEIASITGDINMARMAQPRDAVIQAYDATYRKIALVVLILFVLPLVSSFFNVDFAIDKKQNVHDRAEEGAA